MSQWTAPRLSIPAATIALALVTIATTSHAQVQGPAYYAGAPAKSAIAAPKTAAALPVAAELPSAQAAAQDQLAAVRNWNAEGHLPQKNGFVRQLPHMLLARRGDAAKSGTQTVWSTHLHVAGAYRLRLHLEDVDLPDDASFYVYGRGEEPIRFGMKLADAGSLWTPSVAGEDAFLEVVLPADTPHAKSLFRLQEVLQLLPDADLVADLFTPQSTSCLVDATCVGASTFGAIADARSGVGHLEFIDQGVGYVCSGGLMNDTVTTSFIPYLLTAHHCFSTTAAASTLEVYWDYKTATCEGTIPNLQSLPRSNGSTLLASSASSDFTLVRLTSVPGNRVFLGWDARPSSVVSGTHLYRVSHPFPDTALVTLPQSFSSYLADRSFNGCGISGNNFIFSTLSSGGTFGGSSGSPVMLGNGLVVGQLFGSCGPHPTDGCDYSNHEVDGALSASWPALQPFLSPTVITGPCVRDASTACLSGGRFEVKVSYTTSSSNGNAQVMSFTGQRAESDDSAFFWFFSATNFEMGVKVLDGCGLNNKYWVFIGGLTDQGWTVTVRDTQLGTVKTYSNALGHLSTSVADTSAMACS